MDASVIVGFLLLVLAVLAALWLAEFFKINLGGAAPA